MHKQLTLLQQEMASHGGDIQSASERYNIAPEHWIDLSTGINPVPYPIPDLPNYVFKNLPYWQPDFLAAAEKYYGKTDFLAVPGSQAAINVLPHLLNNDYKNTDDLPEVIVPTVGYQEHAKQWRLAGNTLNFYRSMTEEDAIADINQILANNKHQHLVVIQPNNPTGIRINNLQLRKWASQLEPGYLIVDEAFTDITPDNTLLAINAMPSNLVVFRSFGKFFGIAGIRLGFVFANHALLNKLQNKMGIWQVNGPAQFIAAKAMCDTKWQQNNLKRINNNAQKTENMFSAMENQFPIKLMSNTKLFLSYLLPLPWALAFYNGDDNSHINWVQTVIKKMCTHDDLPSLLEFTAPNKPY